MIVVSAGGAGCVDLTVQSYGQPALSPSTDGAIGVAFRVGNSWMIGTIHNDSPGINRYLRKTVQRLDLTIIVGS
jgi:hypothetical protein